MNIFKNSCGEMFLGPSSRWGNWGPQWCRDLSRSPSQSGVIRIQTQHWALTTTLPWWWCLVSKSYLTLLNSVDSSPPGSSVHGIPQAKILEWVAISFSRGSSWSRDQTLISWIGRQILYHWATWEAPLGTCITHLIARNHDNFKIFTWILW